MHGRGQDPLRKRNPLHGAKRAKVLAACDELLDEIEAVDEQLAQWAAHRHRLVAQLKEQRDLVLPKLIKLAGRRVMPDGNVYLAPVPDDVPALWGRRLRASCLRLLQASGELTLTELHVLLHQHGLRIDSSHPVKALADAMAYECSQGRVRRVARGVYCANRAILPMQPPPKARRPAPTPDPDPDPDTETDPNYDPEGEPEPDPPGDGQPIPPIETETEPEPDASADVSPDEGVDAADQPEAGAVDRSDSLARTGPRLRRAVNSRSDGRSHGGNPDDLFDRLEQLPDAILPRAA